MLFEETETDQDMNHFGEGFSGGFVTEEEFLNAEYYDADMFEAEDDLDLEKTVKNLQQENKKLTKRITNLEQEKKKAKRKTQALDGIALLAEAAKEI